MSYLETYKDMLQTVIEVICDTLNLECAVFDIESNLIASTATYLKRKGNAVHAPSIEEVIINGNILVNKPGYMKSCIGCRFKDKCPATIELLSCIKVDDRSIGVIALTAFTKSGHDRITNNINVYTGILNEITSLISSMIINKDRFKKTLALEEILQSTLNISKDSMIIIDNSGSVSYCNESASKLFSYCSLNMQRIQQIFPENVSNRIMNGEQLLNEAVKINNQFLFVNTLPIIHADKLEGAAIKISMENELKYPKKQFDKTRVPFNLDDIKGKSSTIINLKAKVKKISNSSSTVLITGETGTGKGLLAKALHFESSRVNYPFIQVNCASIPESLFESELFGYEEGAFTGAKKGGKPGRFELAQKGTIFLDEIGEMPLPMQAKLLKVLQEHTIERVGGITSTLIDVRVIAATNKNLDELIKENKFREDLYYRLNVIPMNLPPLRDRNEDILLLANEFLKKYNIKLNKRISGFSQNVMDIFSNYSWPGNIRELENVIEYAVNMADEFITNDDIPSKYSSLANEDSDTFKAKVTSMEFDIIKSALDKYGWDVKGKTAAAEELGIGLRTLYRKLRSFEEAATEELNSKD